MSRAGEITQRLCRSYLFEGVGAEQLEPLARALRSRRCVRGECVFHAGDPADDLFVVLEGEVGDCVVDLDGNEVIHFVRGPGMTFGEAGFFAQDRSRIVDVVALPPTTLIRLDRRDLSPFIDAHPIIRDRALEALASNTRFQTKLIGADQPPSRRGTAMTAITAARRAGSGRLAGAGGGPAR